MSRSAVDSVLLAVAAAVLHCVAAAVVLSAAVHFDTVNDCSKVTARARCQSRTLAASSTDQHSQARPVREDAAVTTRQQQAAHRLRMLRSSSLAAVDAVVAAKDNRKTYFALCLSSCKRMTAVNDSRALTQSIYRCCQPKRVLAVQEQLLAVMMNAATIMLNYPLQ